MNEWACFHWCKCDKPAHRHRICNTKSITKYNLTIELRAVTVSSSAVNSSLCPALCCWGGASSPAPRCWSNDGGNNHSSFGSVKSNLGRVLGVCWSGVTWSPRSLSWMCQGAAKMQACPDWLNPGLCIMMSSISLWLHSLKLKAFLCCYFLFLILGWSAQLLANANKLAPSMYCMYHTDSDTI